MQKIETAVRILFWYVAATLAATQLSLMIEPPHAHMITPFLFLIAPLAPCFWIEAIANGRAGAANIVPLLLSVAISGFGVWLSLRQYRAGSA